MNRDNLKRGIIGALCCCLFTGAAVGGASVVWNMEARAARGMEEASVTGTVSAPDAAAVELSVAIPEPAAPTADLSGTVDLDPRENTPLEASPQPSGENQAQREIHITCWGDSLTAGAGWTTTLARLSGAIVHNAGTSSEDARTIMARQGGDVMMVNHLTIPADCTPVTVAVRATDWGIQTQEGYIAGPLLEDSDHVNPVDIGGILGTLDWTGAYPGDMSGSWTFTRLEPGAEIHITRPTALRTAFDRERNGPDEIMILFLGQNGGYDSVEQLVEIHRKMIDHCKGTEYVVLGFSSGTAEERREYETAMKAAFGRRFISLREYLAAPIYGEDGQTIVSCYGLEDAGLQPTWTDLASIAEGRVPPSLLSDNVHYREITKTVIGEMLYRKMVELNILE